MGEHDILVALGAEPVIEQALPAGRGVLDSEVGTPGPWYGWRLPGIDEVYGWSRSSEFAGDALAYLVDRVGTRTVIGKLADRIATLEAERDEARRLLDLIWNTPNVSVPVELEKQLRAFCHKEASDG